MGTVDKFSCVGLSMGCVMSEHRALVAKILRWPNQKRKPIVALLEQARALAVHVQAVGFHSSRSYDYCSVLFLSSMVTLIAACVYTRDSIVLF